MNQQNEHDVHTDPAAITDLTEVASHEHSGWQRSGAVTGYRANRTLPLRIELARQLRRRRTQLVLGFILLLPFILVVAFEIGEANPNRRSGGFVDLATASAPNFVVFALFVSGSFLLPMVVALFFGDTIASEASWSSLKYLLAAPVPRHRLLRQKFITSGLLSLLALTLLPAVALAVGVFWYGTGQAVSPAGDAIPFGTSVIAIGLSICYIVVHLFWLAGLALLLSVSTDAPLGAVGGAVLVSILSQILDQITALGELRNYLPTHYAFAWSDLIATDIDWSNMASGALSAVAYGTVFTLLAARRFSTKDITS
ncbi:MAG: ABC transporter permease subunit [Pseudonocardiaceae bacterium]|nr:ABC transporter permease subunit [Pseudonocardiaceae bacterium]